MKAARAAAHVDTVAFTIATLLVDSNGVRGDARTPLGIASKPVSDLPGRQPARWKRSVKDLSRDGRAAFHSWLV